MTEPPMIFDGAPFNDFSDLQFLQFNYAGLSVVEAYEFSPEQYGIAFRKDDTATVEKFNNAIAELMADGTIDAIAAKYKLDGQLIK